MDVRVAMDIFYVYFFLFICWRWLGGGWERKSEGEWGFYVEKMCSVIHMYAI